MGLARTGSGRLQSHGRLVLLRMRGQGREPRGPLRPQVGVFEILQVAHLVFCFEDFIGRRLEEFEYLREVHLVFHGEDFRRSYLDPGGGDREPS